MKCNEALILITFIGRTLPMCKQGIIMLIWNLRLQNTVYIKQLYAMRWRW